MDKTIKKLFKKGYQKRAYNLYLNNILDYRLMTFNSFHNHMTKILGDQNNEKNYSKQS